MSVFIEKVKEFLRKLWMRYFDADVKAFVAAEKEKLGKDIAELKGSLINVTVEKMKEAKANIADKIEKKRAELKNKISEKIINRM
jgi:hypothetical protein